MTRPPRVVTPAEAAAIRARSTARAHERLDAIEKALYRIALDVASLRSAVRELKKARGRSHGRVPLARAARLLGVSWDHALKLGPQLDLADLRAEGADRAKWTASLARVEELLAARTAGPAAPADSEPAPSGRPGATR